MIEDSLIAFYLHTDKCIEIDNDLVSSSYFVEKPLILENLDEYIGIFEKYICITRLRWECICDN